MLTKTFLTPTYFHSYIPQLCDSSDSIDSSDSSDITDITDSNGSSDSKEQIKKITNFFFSFLKNMFFMKTFFSQKKIVLLPIFLFYTKNISQKNPFSEKVKFGPAYSVIHIPNSTCIKTKEVAPTQSDNDTGALVPVPVPRGGCHSSPNPAQWVCCVIKLSSYTVMQSVIQLASISGYLWIRHHRKGNLLPKPQTAQLTPSTIHCTLYTEHCTLYTVHCTLLYSEH